MQSFKGGYYIVKNVFVGDEGGLLVGDKGWETPLDSIGQDFSYRLIHHATEGNRSEIFQRERVTDFGIKTTLVLLKSLMEASPFNTRRQIRETSGPITS